MLNLNTCYYELTIKYIRVEVNTPALDMVSYLHGTIGESSLPELIISVSRGEDELKVSEDIIQAVKRGLVKSTKNNSVWITTGGINVGASSLIGQVFMDQKDQAVIGIASWGNISSRNNLVVNQISQCFERLTSMVCSRFLLFLQNHLDSYNRDQYLNKSVNNILIDEPII